MPFPILRKAGWKKAQTFRSGMGEEGSSGHPSYIGQATGPGEGEQAQLGI